MYLIRHLSFDDLVLGFVCALILGGILMGLGDSGWMSRKLGDKGRRLREVFERVGAIAYVVACCTIVAVVTLALFVMPFVGLLMEIL